MPATHSNKVKHIGPEDASILILGEFPDEEDDFLGIPYVGTTGAFLKSILEQVGIDFNSCRVGHLLKYRPQDNNWDNAKGSAQLEESFNELYLYLEQHPPKVIIALGDEVLKFLLGFEGISHWRGSVLRREKSFVIPSYDPDSARVKGSFGPQIVFDFKRAKEVAQDGYVEPEHNFIIDPPSLDEYLPLLVAAPFITADIESIRESTHILSIGFAWSEKDAIVIKNRARAFDEQGRPTEDIDEEFKKKCAQAFETCKDLTFHNGTFDVDVLRINDIPVPMKKYTHDTMYAQRVLEPELPMGLAFCASIYTREPYYKDDGKQVGKQIPLTLYTYNALDCIVTWQTRKAQEAIFAQNPKLLWSYKQDHEDILVALDMQKNGMLVDTERLTLLEKLVQKRLETDARMMFILAGKIFNFASPKQVQDLLYTDFGLPIRRKRKGNITTDEDAIVSLLQFCKREYETKKTMQGQETWLKKMGVLKMLLQVRGHEKMLSSYIKFTASPDNRVRSSWNIAGTETGRWSASLYVDGTGFNAQTLPREVFSDD